MRSIRIIPRLTGMAAAFWAPLALAHDAGAFGAGLGAGFLHPFSGFDHLAAMLAVGLWAAQSGPRPLWRLPLAFMLAMVLGAGLAFAGVRMPSVEVSIAASVFVLGLFISAEIHAPPAVAVAIVAVFAVFHGHAHGIEVPQTALPWRYAAGFLAATGALLATGILAGRAGARHAPWMARAIGGLLSAGGAWMLVAH